MTAQVTDSPDPAVADHVRRYLATDGADGYLEGGSTNLVLTTVGRSTGQRRRTGLFFGQDGERLVLVASGVRFGDPTLPHWYRNLRANPEVEVQIRAERFTALARIAEGAERTRLWRLMADDAPVFERHQASVPHDIPVVVLERTS
ncbi:nitroreductase/quinone reductase family protein [Phytoactinopolyspora mesophila]|uniref:Nitroreductase family deazaflavin-dependent oxidoreductase n=1 Tax=Phytoactinopolyspora mesophila TaxID=2650750 RepID=A0A7K3M249_9ACTN|nr:nitroreductase/quinone reductase family protein [Phytoactinopolyspora mesophila]NDL57354.1 nitroreductase family deazaflavin-dependent oxidoreductase [Phytoactinopolyspora mesophila]